MKCKDVMKMNVECLSPMDNCHQAAQRMRDLNVGFLPVCDEHMSPHGTLTDRDICTRVCAEDKTASQVRVTDVMSHTPVTCAPDDDLSAAEQLMSQHKKSRIMVVEGGKLIGIISLSDIAKHEPGDVAARTLKDIASRETRP